MTKAVSISNESPSQAEDVTVNLETVTPSIAERWLEANENNRSLSNKYVSRYAKLMDEGEWMVAPDAIAFDTEGRLINGQHRLNAIIEHGESQRFIVARGLDPQVFMATDGGKTRQASDALDIEGYKNYSQLAAVARRVVLFEEDRLDHNFGDVETHEIVDTVKRHDPKMPEAVAQTLNYRNDIQGWLSPSNLGFVYFTLSFRDESRASEFMYKVATGLKIEESSDPTKMLRDRLHDLARQPGSVDYGLQLALTIKAGNYYLNDETRKFLRWSPGANEPFPLPDVSNSYPFPESESGGKDGDE
jgi:hypothetical protein